MAEQSHKRLVKKLKEEVILDTDPETVVFDTRQQFPPEEIAARNWLPKSNSQKLRIFEGNKNAGA